MSHDLPPALRSAIADLLDAGGRSGLAETSARISTAYRSGGASSGVVTGPAAALAYAAARMPATFGAVSAALARLDARAVDFAPASLLDAGCGPGTAGFAALECWPGIASVTQLDHNRDFLALAADLAARAGDGGLGQPRQVRGDLTAIPADIQPHDLVIASYALTECGDAAALRIAGDLWAATSGALVLVEPGTPAAHQRLMAVRERLLASGGTVAAPCPHLAPCPVRAPDWCHFSVRVSRSRDHRRAKAASMGYEDEKFAYLVVVRPDVALAAPQSRILDRPDAIKPGTTLKLCRPDGTLDHHLVPRRDKPAFAAARRLEWGDEVG